MPHEYQVSLKGIITLHKRALIVKGQLPSGICFWDLPGGRMERGESIMQALQREVAEELPSLQSLKVHTLLYATAGRHLEGNKDLITLFYRITGSLSEIKLSSEHLEYRWIDASEIDTIEKDTGYKLFTDFDTAIKLALGN